MRQEPTALYVENAGYLHHLQECYRADPNSVDRSWRCVFDLLTELEAEGARPSEGAIEHTLATVFRAHGHLAATLDPLGLVAPLPISELSALLASIDVGSADRGANGFDRYAAVIERLRSIYCGNLAVESAHIDQRSLREWIADAIERPQAEEVETLRRAMKSLVAVEEFERIMAVRFTGKKRFGAEGAEVLVATLERLLANAASAGITDVVIGTMHRGRLSVIGTVLGKPLDELFAEFKGRYPFADDRAASADVPYHLGHEANLKIEGRPLRVTLCPNPSHLEAVNAIALGRVRARQDVIGDRSRVLGVVLHTDASVIAQGVVAEALQMSRLAGFDTDGTVHIIVNNQIGFTTEREEARTSHYCTGAWKAIDSLILHVNGDHPESAIRAVDLAFEFRQAQKRDSVVDLVCYRRNGHNEVDEPRFTQPVLYQSIACHPSVTSLFGTRLVAHGVLTQGEIDGFRTEAITRLDAAFDSIESRMNAPSAASAGATRPEPSWPTPIEPVTGVLTEELRHLLQAMSSVPADLAIDPKLMRLVNQRRARIDSGAPWAVGEALAFATLLVEGTAVRLSGQDVVRGAFSHRHFALTDTVTGRRRVMLNHLGQPQARFDVVDSLLSEYAVLGFEYGYSLDRPDALVIWEAQFGDFANGAQIVIDQFVTSGAEKWRQRSGLVILLPHGLEGQGPEHSSARPERILQLCARDNIEVAQPSTPANYFHLLRRQVRRTVPKPLIIMGAKTLLRLPAAVSPLASFGPGTAFRPIIDSVGTGTVRSVLLCSGKLAYDLEHERSARGVQDVAIIRLEMFYPFPEDVLVPLFRQWGDARVAWVQEEPRNVGGWSYLREPLELLLAKTPAQRPRVMCISRPESSSPAGSFHADHERDQRRLVEQAFQWAAGGGHGELHDVTP